MPSGVPVEKNRMLLAARGSYGLACHGPDNKEALWTSRLDGTEKRAEVGSGRKETGDASTVGCLVRSGENEI